MQYTAKISAQPRTPGPKINAKAATRSNAATGQTNHSGSPVEAIICMTGAGSVTFCTAPPKNRMAISKRPIRLRISFMQLTSQKPRALTSGTQDIDMTGEVAVRRGVEPLLPG